MKDDTISRQAALDALPKKQKGIGGESWMKTYRRSGYNDCVEDCMKALQALPSAQPGWIPVAERLPDESGEYLVTIRYKDGGSDLTDLIKYNSYWREWNDLELFGGKVIAWQPKPEPWEGDAE